MDSGDQNTPENTAREKKGGFGTPYSIPIKLYYFLKIM